MSLPAAQQRILDGIADTLRASEPRLVSMFAIFTRLTKNEARPWREQLPTYSGLRRLLMRIKPSPRSARMPQQPSNRAVWVRVLVATQLAIALTVVGILISVSGHKGPACGASTSHLTGRVATASNCGIQAGPLTGQFTGPLGGR
jgi:hypothetical protein